MIDWKLAAMSLVLVPFVFYPTVWFGKRLRLLSKSSQEEMAEMANVLYETLTGNRIVKAFGMEKAEAGRFRKVTQRVFQLNLRQKMTHALVIAADGDSGRSRHRGFPAVRAIAAR